MFRAAFLLAALVAAIACRAQAGKVSAPDNDHEDEACELQLAQSMPEKLVLPPLEGLEPTHQALVSMIDEARESIRIASFYLELTPQQAALSAHPSTRPGAEVREAIKRAGERGVDVEIVLDNSSTRCVTNQADVEYLRGGARIKFLNMRRLLGGGILHSKFIVVDNSTLYVGSANFDWRSYSQVKEMGLVARHCPRLAKDLDKIHNTYSIMAERETLPDPGQFAHLETRINLRRPLLVGGLRVLLAGSPPAFNGPARETGRSDDLEALLHTIRAANESIDISVMNYSPAQEFGWSRFYWPAIDDALREAAAVRNIRVRLLFSRWAHSKPSEAMWYRSLDALQSEALRGGSIRVRLFEVPAFDDWQRALPYARVKHDKYMVTDAGLYLGTSNWTPDYFTKTCGVGLVVEPERRDTPSPLIQTMRAVFERDFNSEYAHEL